MNLTARSFVNVTARSLLLLLAAWFANLGECCVPNTLKLREATLSPELFLTFRREFPPIATRHKSEAPNKGQRAEKVSV